MIRKCILFILFLLFASALAGCGNVQRLFHERLADTPAPTAVPLPGSTPLPTAHPTVAIAEEATRTPTPTSEPRVTVTPVPSLTPVVSPTRVVPPAETINLPPGFGISVFAQGLSGPRMMALGPDGELCVAERGAGRIVCPLPL